MLRQVNPSFFGLKHPAKAIAGFGFFDHQEFPSIPDAWSRFVKANGDPSYARFVERIGGYRGFEVDIDRRLNCLVLYDAEFWPRAPWIPWGADEDWIGPIVAFKRYDLDSGAGRRLAALIEFSE